VKCWDFHFCPETVHRECPAFPDHGHDCWRVARTRCPELRGLPDPALKMDLCRSCDFFLAVNGNPPSVPG